jgi:hypothetical protein
LYQVHSKKEKIMTNVVNLPGERLAGLMIDLHHKLKDGVRSLDELALFCQGKNPFENTSVVKVWKTWKTIRLGTGLQIADDFLEAIKSAGMKIGEMAEYILGKHALRVAGSVTKVELVACSVAELGFKDGATCKDIYVRAKELGLRLCSNEAALQLRLQCADQMKSEWRVIATEPIIDRDGNHYLFRIEYINGEQWLSVDYGHPGHFWDGDRHFVFLRRK